MSTGITTQELIRHFEKQLRQLDRRGAEAGIGKEPNYPMLVVFLGKEAVKGYESIATRLLQIWPQYQQELQFIGVLRKGNGMKYVHLTEEQGVLAQNSVAKDEVRTIVTSLFGLQTHFRDRSKLLIYYVLDTTELSDAQEFERWIAILGEVKQMIGVDMLDTLDMLMLLLNEGFSYKTVANQVKNVLCDFYADRSDGPCKSVLLLSNKRSDNVILEDWNVCYRICSSVMALSNNDESNILRALYGNCVMTASYALQEKPSEMIGQVIVEALIDELANYTLSRESLRLDIGDLVGRLGLSKEGTMELLDRYAEQNLSSLLPTEEQLELFPRKDSEKTEPLCDMSFREFNEFTMNAWECYLAQVVKRVQKKISTDIGTRKQWSTEYREFLRSNYSTSEIIQLANHLERVREMLGQARRPSQEVNVLQAANSYLKYMLSSDSEMIDYFVKTIELLGNQVSEFFEEWDRLEVSRKNDFPVRDNNVIMYYSRRARDYFDRYGYEMAETFKKLIDRESLKRFMESMLDNMIDRISNMSCPFEEELEQRLSEDALPVDAKQYIRQKLTGEEVYTYLQVDFSFGQPLLSAILLKEGTPLHSNLYTNLPSTTYYYDTGCSNAAEALILYEVGSNNLINGEGR